MSAIRFNLDPIGGETLRAAASSNRTVGSMQLKGHCRYVEHSTRGGAENLKGIVNHSTRVVEHSLRVVEHIQPEM